MDKYQPCPYTASCVYRHFHVNITHHPLKTDLPCCAFSLRQLSFATCNNVQSHGLFVIAKLLVKCRPDSLVLSVYTSVLGHLCQLEPITVSDICSSLRLSMYEPATVSDICSSLCPSM